MEAGPIYGYRMWRADGEPGDLEREVLDQDNATEASEAKSSITHAKDSADHDEQTLDAC